MFKETILQNHKDNWQDKQRRVRVRDNGQQILLTYKEGSGEGMQTIEHEVIVSDYQETVGLLRAMDMDISRIQEKYRHSFQFDECQIDIDTWPGIPTYLEIEGPSIEALQVVANSLGLAWDTRYEKDALHLIGELYGLDLHNVTEYTFDNYPTTLSRVDHK